MARDEASAGREPGAWLWVGKPLRPPFRDGSTVLAASFARSLPAGIDVAYFGDPARPLGPGHTVVDVPPMGYAPTLRDKARALAVLLAPAHRHRSVHFFFTPNPVTSRVAGALRRLARRRRFVQSVTSADRIEAHAPLLAGLDRVVVLSDHTRGRLLETGLLDEERVVRIHPGVDLPEAPPPLPERPTVLYAGDLDPTVGDRIEALARALPSDVRLVVAARPKGPKDAEVRGRLRTRLADLHEAGRFDLLAEVDDMEALFAAASLVVHLADHVARKVDLPLVLLEALARGRGVVTTRAGPLPEIFAGADAPPGAAVAGSDIVEFVVAALADGRHVAWSAAAVPHARARFDARRLGPRLSEVYAAIG
ncbi:MAG: glycosyltransferase [Deltaproteobacteria bacterium]|nr:MAG: glycosyltransferase [Deltaproteobacteria bacterium]